MSTPPSTGPAAGALAPAARAEEAGFTSVVARTQGQLVRRRFLRHRGAMAGLVALAAVVLLSVTSIGAGPLPGWWGQSYLATSDPVDGGRPTLDLLPAFLDGDGPAVGPHPFGQDNVGTDYFALTMRGAQQTLLVGLLAGVVSTVTGVLFGALAGFFRGGTEAVLMRVVDLVIAVPVLLVAAVVGRATGGAGVLALGVALGLLLFTTMARLLRGEILSLREKEFVEAARALGARPGRIIVRHVLPNAVGSIVVNATLTIASAILLESAVSFLGVGVRPPDSSLGLQIANYQAAFQTRPWLFWWPAAFIVVIALAVNFIGDGLRDAFDPRQTKVRD